MPHEIMTARMIRAKKPWTLAGLAALMIGMTGHYALTERVGRRATRISWSGAAREVKEADDYARTHRATMTR